MALGLLFSHGLPVATAKLLVPLENLVAGKHFELEVCFADGAVPECASFDLVVQACRR